MKLDANIALLTAVVFSFPRCHLHLRNVIRMIKSRRMRWAGHVARMGEKNNACRIFVGKPERKGPLGRQGRSWVDNVKMDLREAGSGDMDWIDVTQKRDQWRALVNAVMNLWVSS
jgi:hypothetical protein